MLGLILCSLTAFCSCWSSAKVMWNTEKINYSQRGRGIAASCVQREALVGGAAPPYKGWVLWGMGIPALKAARGKSDKDGESSKVERAAAVEVVGECGVFCESFAWAMGESCSCCGWQKGQGKQGSPGCFSVRSCGLAHIREDWNGGGEREKTSGGIEEGGSTRTVVSWCVRAAGVSQMDWKKGKETCGVQKKKKK